MNHHEPSGAFYTAEQMQLVVKEILAEKEAQSAASAPPEECVPPFKQLRREANILGGALLFYFGILNAAVFAVMISAATKQALAMDLTGAIMDPNLALDEIVASMMEAIGNGYLMATVIAVLGLLVWKKPRYFSNVIMQKGKRMDVGTFFALLSLAMASQLIAQLFNMGLQWLLEICGQDASGLQDAGAAQADTLTMFLYIGIAAPIAEELLFRGLVMRSVAPYNRKLAIFASALLFGLFHGSPPQTPYAILVGIVLGYVALEYHIVWAVLLHLFNNLVFAMLLPEVLSVLPVMIVDWIMWAFMIGFFLAAVLVLIVKHEQVRESWKEERVQLWQRHAFFRAPVVIVLIALCLFNLVATTQMLLS